MAVAANWSELPKELLNQISQRIDNEINLLLFRSICSNWRSSSITNLSSNNFPLKFPLFKFSIYINSENRFFSQRNIFLIKPPLQQTLTHRRPRLITVTQNSSGKLQLSQPSHRRFSLPSTFSLDLTEFSLLHLRTDFIIHKPLDTSYHQIEPKKVVAVTPLIFAILLYGGNVVLYSCGDKRWKEIRNIPRTIEDICVFKGRIYAVQMSSFVTVSIAPEDLSFHSVDMDIDVDRHSGDVDFLVESRGELLLVDIRRWYVSDTFKIDVFRLDEKEKEWVKLTSLGDRALFFGRGCSFSASALDLCVTKGNCVIFMDNLYTPYERCESRMCIFDMDLGRIIPLDRYPDYFNLFRSAPDWIGNSCMRKIKRGPFTIYRGKASKRM